MEMYGGDAMQHPIPILWCDKSHTLSGNHEIENLIANVALPPSYWWTLDDTGESAVFCGNRKSNVKRGIRGQITLHGKSSNSCRLVDGKTSSGQLITVNVISSPRKKGAKSRRFTPPEITATLPHPIRRDSIEADLLAYGDTFRGCVHELDIAKALGWGKYHTEIDRQGLRPILVQIRKMVRGSKKREAWDELQVLGFDPTRSPWFE